MDTNDYMAYIKHHSNKTTFNKYYNTIVNVITEGNFEKEYLKYIIELLNKKNLDNKEIDTNYIYQFINNKVHYDNAIDIFTNNLKHYMKIKDKNVMDVAKDLDISYSTVNDWYNGRKYPRPDKIQLLADYLGIPTSFLTENRDYCITPAYENNSNNSSVIVPVLGRIPAGIPLEAIEEILDYEEIPAKWLTGDKQFFALRIKRQQYVSFL